MLARSVSGRASVAGAVAATMRGKPTPAVLRPAGRMRGMLGLLAILLLVQLGALLRAPVMWLPDTLTLRLAPGESVTLAPLARATIQRDASGRWLLSHDSTRAAKPFLLRPGRAPESLASTPLDDALLTLPGAIRVARQAAPGGKVAFAFAGSDWRYDGASLLRDGHPQPPCPDARWAVRLGAWWNRFAPAPLGLARPLSFGGNLHCGNRIGIADILPDAATISRAQDDGLRITDLEHRPRALDGVQAIVMGSLRLELDAGSAQPASNRLALRPQRRVPQFAAPSIDIPAQAEWHWSTRALWRPAAGGPAQGVFLLALCIAALAAVVVVHSPTARQTHWIRVTGTLALLVAGLFAMALQRMGQAPAAAMALLLTAAALAHWLSAPGARTPANVCAALLLAAGLLLQLELGLGGGDLRYYQKTSAMLAVGLAALSLWRLAPPDWRAGTGKQRTIEHSLLALAALALAALAAQVLWGDETGVFDFQPVELAKLALAAMTAHCLALRFSWHDGPQFDSTLARWLALAAPVILFLTLLAIALLQVDDYSPLLLLLVWAGGMALAYSCAAGKRGLTVALVASGAALAFGIGALRDAGPAALPANFYAERFQAWLAPGAHPHTGQQVLRAASAIAQGGIGGADATFGLRSAGLPAGDAVAIPAVQDDFAPAFFINRHGLLAALALWCLQAAFIACLLWQALHANRLARMAGTYQQAWAARFRCFALCGGAAFVAGHLLLSWGTNLAILPVMGQPMSFLSAGGSHLLFFLLPLLGLSAASNEE